MIIKSYLSRRNFFGVLAALAALWLSAGVVNAATTTVSYQVSASADDGYAQSATVQDTAATYLKIGDERTYAVPYQMSAMRFGNVHIPRSATIVGAYLKISSINTDYRGQIYGVIAAEASDNPADFSSRLIGNAALTTATVAWDYKTAWSPDTQYTSPDISNVLQEVVNRPGFSSGNSIAIYYSTRELSGKARSFASYEYSPASAAVLEVTYETYTISGYVKTSDNTPVENVIVSGGANIESSTTDASGYYELIVPSNWSGTITPSYNNRVFEPQSKSYSNITANLSEQSFAITATTLVTYQVSSSLDDAYHQTWYNQNTGARFLKAGSNHRAGMRFVEVDIPQGSYIKDAHLKIAIYYRTGIDIPTKITAEASDNPENFGLLELYNRSWVSTKISWNTWDVTTSPNIATIIEELINRPGWSAGNAMVLAIYNFEGSATGEVWLKSYDYDVEYGTSTAPRLEITWTPKAWISGYIHTSEGAGLEGVSVSANNQGGSDVTDIDGYYEVAIPHEWSGTVVVSKPWWVFSPENRTYNNVISDQTNQDHTGFAPHTISGYIITANEVKVEGVQVSANNGGETVTTDSEGYYELRVPYEWSGTVTPNKSGLNFNPQNRSYNNVTVNQIEQDYTAGASRAVTTLTYQVSSSADDGWQQGWTLDLTSILLTVSEQTRPDIGIRFNNINVPQSVLITNARLQLRIGGSFESGLITYKVQAEASDNAPLFSTSAYISSRQKTQASVNWNHQDPYTLGWHASPNISGVIQEVINRSGWSGGNSLAIIYSNASGGSSSASCQFLSYDLNPSYAPKLQISFESLRRISGYVRTSDEVGLESVLVSADNGGGSATTDFNGYYEIIIPVGWSGAVTPTKSGWGFTPVNYAYLDVAFDLSNRNYTAFQPKISGYVEDGGGFGIEGVSISADNEGGSDTTDPNGYYEVTVPYDWSGTVTPSKAGWGVNPISRAYLNVIDDQVNQNYTTTPPPVISGHVLDTKSNGADGVLLLANNGGSSNTTDSNGYYEISVPYDWSGMVTPSKGMKLFDPLSRSYSNLTMNQSEQDFVLLSLMVRADGSGNYATIQAAIDAAVDGDEVIVHPGRYTGQGNYNIDFLGKAITVRSIEPNNQAIVAATIIDPNRAGAGFYFHNGEDINSVVDGLTITQGWSPVGGGIWCRYSSPTIRNCIIRDCFAMSHGGGIGLEDSNSAISNCIVTGNSTTEIGGGIACVWASNPTITNCIITGNTVGWAGGGIGALDCNLTVKNCTLSNNTVESDFGGFGGAICVGGGTVTINNSILWNDDANEGAEIAMHGSDPPSTVSVSYSNVEGGQGAVYVDPCCTLEWDDGNIDIDPCFAEPGYWDNNDTLVDTNDDFWVDGDYHLKSEAGRWKPSIYIRLDLNGDGLINLVDYAVFSSFWQTQGSLVRADFDRNNIVDMFDLKFLSDGYLMRYPQGEWVFDDVTSPCIDAGDPASDWTEELWPHGKWINMGAYGGTPQASMSLSAVGNKADLNNNGVVDGEDLALFVEMWLVEEVLLSEDITRDGSVNFSDFAEFGENWGWGE